MNVDVENDTHIQSILNEETIIHSELKSQIPNDADLETFFRSKQG